MKNYDNILYIMDKYIMDKNDIVYYLGLTFVVCLLIYVVIKSLTLQLNIVEGLTSNRNTSSGGGMNSTDKDKIAEAVKSNTNTIEDDLLISKYRPNYEQTIIELENNIGYALLSSVLNNAESISNNPTSTESQTIITSINNMKTFKDVLNDAMKVLDTK